MKILAVVGSTASGKTKIAIELAKRLDTEVISADSRLVYKDFNIGTAKPSVEEMDGIKHHMIDIVSPDKVYTAGDYKKDAQVVVDRLIKQGKIPIIVGGTGLYIKSLLGGLDIPEIAADDIFRDEMEKLAQEKGKTFLHDKLKEIDPTTAQKLHPNDSVRVIRALEVYQTTQKTMSEINSMSKPLYDVYYAGLNAEDREFIYQRTNHRVDLMLEAGLVDEVRQLTEKYGRTLPLLKTLGYKEICYYFDDKMSLEDAVELIKKHTRNYAKRQLTWFRANSEINWFYIDKQNTEEIVEQILREYDV